MCIAAFPSGREKNDKKKCIKRICQPFALPLNLPARKMVFHRASGQLCNARWLLAQRSHEKKVSQHWKEEKQRENLNKKDIYFKFNIYCLPFHHLCKHVRSLQFRTGEWEEFKGDWWGGKGVLSNTPPFF